MMGRDIWDILPLFEKKPPKPKIKLVCPWCGSSAIYFKDAQVFCRRDGQYRLTIALKCEGCAYTAFFGVHITEDEYYKLREAWETDRIDYTDVGHVCVNLLEG